MEGTGFCGAGFGSTGTLACAIFAIEIESAM
jgi:hypothetical protein